MDAITPAGYAFIGLTALVGVLVAILVFALLRFASAARDTRHHLGGRHSETALLSAALEEAVGRLKAQEQANRARAEASERLSAQIVDSLVSGLLVVSGDGHVRMLNPAARRILAVGDVDLPVPWEGLLSRWPALAEVVRESLESGVAVTRRAISIGSGDRPLHLGLSVSPLADDTSPATGAICLFSDLTAVVALEEQLRLKETLARLGELTAGLAHEFRNGLATIHGYARLLDPAVLPEPERTYVQGLRDETTALGRVVHNFLNFARPEPLSLAPVDLESVIASAADDVALADGAFEVRGTFGAVDGDDVLLRQAFSNLIRNAAEACARSGVAPHIVAEGRPGPAPGWVRVTVTDNGPGVPADAGDRVFRPFFTTRPDGTGLGLAIVQKVIVTHNGRVWIDGPGRGGARFVIELPARSVS
jgi:signal transduction histidine kinase